VSTVDLYAVLGVTRDASTEEIRAAWTAAVTGVGPADPSFRVFNQAGEVLLDPARREKYDAELAAADAVTPASVDAPPEVGAPPAPRSEPGLPAGRRARGVPNWVLAMLLVLALVVGGAAAFADGPIGRALPDRPAPVSAAALADAVRSAESAIVPVLSYDYRHLDDDRTAAIARMTDDFAKDYRKTFAIIEENAPATKTVVKVEVLASALSSSSPDRVDVLLFVNRPTTNKATPKATVYRDQVTLEMTRSGDRWLVDDMHTTLPA
jgi:Mce-associated membrane protein